MTSLVIGIILIVGGIAFAAYPLLRRSASADAPTVPDASGGAGRATATPMPDAFDAELEELELDRAMGKLAEADYQRLRASLDARRRAARPAAAIPASATDDVPVDAVASRDLEAAAEELVRAEGARVVSCGTCGPRPEPGARFCSHCGRPIGGCPGCGTPIRQDGARFCDQCGSALVA